MSRACRQAVLLGLDYSAEALGDIPPNEPRAPGQDSRFVDRTWDGAAQALDIIAQHSPGAVLLNNELLDRIADNIPEFADRVADIRSKAAEALAPPSDDDLDDDAGEYGAERAALFRAETGEVRETDAIAQKVAERRGAAPLDGTPDPGSSSFPG
jgi:hypothetical protein